ncbi:MAG: hypothetical protein LBQ13_03835 [Endomicrobium sp.]|jgi:hypothetical protein|nr:hypothetical protein [Endomicrobium sp.]
MRRIAAIMLLIFFFFTDFIFFDYDMSDLKHFKEDVSEITKKIDRSLELDLPFYFDKSRKIRTCKEYLKHRSKSKIKITNAFEKELSRNLDKKCGLVKILSNAKISKNSLVDYITLLRLEAWHKDLFFKYTCEKTDYENNEVYKKYTNAQELVKNNVVEIKMITTHSAIVYNNIIKKKFFIKEIMRASFTYEQNKGVLVEISVADPTDNYIECTKYAIFSRKSINHLLIESK